MTFDQLRPMATDRPILEIPTANPDYEACDLVVYEAGEEHRIGLVLVSDTAALVLTVQCLEGRRGKRSTTWLPVWSREGELVRALRCPSLGAAATESVRVDDVIAVVALDGTHSLTPESQRLLDAKGFRI